MEDLKIFIPGVGERCLSDIVTLCSQLAISFRFLETSDNANRIIKAASNKMFDDVCEANFTTYKYIERICSETSKGPTLAELEAYNRIINTIAQCLISEDPKQCPNRFF